MTTTEIRLKCLELALNTKGIQPDAFNFIKEAKIYENYLLGITEQTVAKKEEPLPPYKELTNKELLESALDTFTQKTGNKKPVQFIVGDYKILIQTESPYKIYYKYKDFRHYTEVLYLEDFFDMGNDKFEVKKEIKDSEGYGSLESYTKRLGNTCNHH